MNEPVGMIETSGLVKRHGSNEVLRGRKVLVVDDWSIDAPHTKRAIEVLEALGLRERGSRDERLLLVLDRGEEPVWKSFRNLGRRVQIVLPDELNTYDVLVNDWLVFSRATLDAAVARFTKQAEPEAGAA